MSVRIFDKAGYKVIFYNNCGKVYDGDQLILEAPVGSDELYHVTLSAISSNNTYRKFNQTSKGSLILWHRRLAHLGFDNIQRLEKMVKGMTITDEEKPQLCDPCIMGKMTKQIFQQ
jgi:hypothetical protein